MRGTGRLASSPTFLSPKDQCYPLSFRFTTLWTPILYQSAHARSYDRSTHAHTHTHANTHAFTVWLWVQSLSARGRPHFGRRERGWGHSSPRAHSDRHMDLGGSIWLLRCHAWPAMAAEPQEASGKAHQEPAPSCCFPAICSPNCANAYARLTSPVP